MPDRDEKGELLKPPPAAARGTTPSGTPAEFGETTDLGLTESSLFPLRQRYDILAELGRGGMGIVYRARDRETGDIVALKVLRPEIAARPEVIERFKSELLLARKITHKNVCRTYELLRFGDTVAIAMEYVEGESLRHILSRYSPLSVRKGVEWASQICAGLAEAHAQGVVHRDLKPANIVIDRDGHAKVMDFGIARSLEAEMTQTGITVGTPAYMSPEQAAGKPVDARSDIYSLGLILYEMFTGRPALQAESPAVFVVKQMHETPPPPREVDPYLPFFLDRTIQTCLEKDPKKRFQSVAELEAALEEQAIPQVPGGEPVPAPHLCVWGKRDWVLLALGVIGLLYFLKFRNTVFPAATKPLEVNATTARRVAEDISHRLGRPFWGPPRHQLEFRGGSYRNELLARVFDRSQRGSRYEMLGRLELPLYWKINFSFVPAILGEALGEVADEYAVVNRKGKLAELANPLNPFDSWPSPAYKVPPLDQRRAVAREAFELACGPLPPDLSLIETIGGEQGASYNATWRPLRPAGAPAVAEISLLAERPVSIKCKLPNATAELALPLDILAVLVQAFARLVALVFLVVLLVYFGIGQCYRSPLLRKRLPLAAVLGIATVWVVATTINEIPNSGKTGAAPSLPLLLGSGLAAAGLILAALVTTEDYLARRAPALVASYALAMRGKITERVVGLAVVRGALAGLILAGVETILLHLSLGPAPGSNKPARVAQAFLLVFVDPTPVGQALASISPTLFVISAAAVNAVLVALVFIGLQWALFGSKEFLKHPTDRFHRFAILLELAFVAVFLAFAFRLQFGQVLGLFGFGLVPLSLLFLLTLLLLSQDVLTVVTAVGTYVLWTLNHPLLEILQDVGNSGQWAVFIGWGVLVAAAAAVAFRGELVRAGERLKAGMQ